MPIVHVHLIEGRSPAQKADLIREVTEAVERSIGAPKPSIRVLVQEIPGHAWGVAGVPKQPAPDEGGEP